LIKHTREKKERNTETKRETKKLGFEQDYGNVLFCSPRLQQRKKKNEHNIINAGISKTTTATNPKSTGTDTDTDKSPGILI